MADVVNGGRRGLLAIAGFAIAVMATAPALAARFFHSRTARYAKTRARGSSDFETAALIHLRTQKFDEAIAVLEAAAERELPLAEPSLRLLDLLATLYARKGLLVKLTVLAARVEAAAQGGCATALLDRAGKWRNEQSKWRCDRANPEATIKWRRTTHEVEGAGRYAKRDDIIIPM